MVGASEVDALYCIPWPKFVCRILSYWVPNSAVLCSHCLTIILMTLYLPLPRSYGLWTITAHKAHRGGAVSAQESSAPSEADCLGSTLLFPICVTVGNLF